MQVNKKQPITGTEDLMGGSDKEDDLHKTVLILPIWPSYSSTNTPAVTTDDKKAGPRKEKQGLWMTLKDLRSKKRKLMRKLKLSRRSLKPWTDAVQKWVLNRNKKEERGVVCSRNKASKMAVLDSCPKHNMVAHLEKTDGNVEFHEILDFLTRSSIHHALTVSPIVSTSFVEQFWTSAKSKTINNVRHIVAKVASKSVSISEAS
ncbi:hypothetical protein Tco_0086198 [Tanacetum coccineum]